MVRPIRVLLSSTLALGICSLTEAGQGTAPAKPAARPAAAKPAASAAKPAPAPPASAGMTNADVIKLVQAGIGESVVVTAVRTAARTSFQLDADNLIALKKAGVSDTIVAVMLDPKAALPAAAPAVAFAPGGGNLDSRARVDDPHAAVEIPRDPGIYIDLGDDKPNLVPLEPTVFSQAKTGGMLTSALTYGIKKAKWKAVVRAPGATFRVPDATPVFYFYFEQKSAGLGGSGGFVGWLAGATSPNEFVLARMTVKSRERELIVGEFGLTGASTGTRSKDTVEFDVKKLGGGAYRVTPLEPLPPGEYTFFYAAGASALGAGATGKLFDFGVGSASSRH